jgi:hypothetical protein
MGKQTILPAGATVDTIPEKQETWNDKLKLTESNLRHWLLGGWEKQRQILKEIGKRVEDEGVSKELIQRCLYYETLSEEKAKRETLKLVTNPKTGKLWDIPTLQNAGKLSDSEIEGIIAEHGGREPPYYHVTSIRRVLDDRTNPPKEYLVYTILFEGLCVGKREGHINPEANMRINESAIIGYHLMPKISWDNVKDKYLMAGLLMTVLVAVTKYISVERQLRR